MWMIWPAWRKPAAQPITAWLIRLAPLLGDGAHLDRWGAAREQIRTAVLREAWSEQAGAYAGSFESDDLDASVLLLPLVRFLPADDEPIARTMLEHWLTGWGYEVVTVRDGEAALNALAADPELRLAIVDWVMPKVDGIEVCRQIRGGPAEPYIYVVLLTAKDDKSDIIQGLDAGADDYLVKPCNPLELKVRLRAGRRVIELQEQLVAARETLRFEAMHDSLTQLLNRGATLEQLERELVRFGGEGVARHRPLGIRL